MKMVQAVGAVLSALLIGGVIVTGAAHAEESAQEVLEKVKKKYDSISDAELKFSQRVKFPIGRVEQQVRGTLFLKKENHYRVETDEQVIVTDGKTVWSYSATNNQVLIDNFKMDERSFSPERILVAAPEDFSASLSGREKVGRFETIVLKLVPRSEESNIKSMKLWVSESDWMMRKVEMLDLNGKETTYTVTEVKVNSGLLDSRFSYQIPEGAEVVDLR